MLIDSADIAPLDFPRTARGEMDDDPILYALNDRGSRLAGALMSRSYFNKRLP
ncbi:hypothetical protein IM543_01455 [Massilia sp. UMI-21]|nr:hypothetical protein IM543_01455 [Massilia sp. UMI-21]